jgi:hypothetical protein
MSTITIGRSLVPVEHIAFVEHFDLAANPRLQTERQFQTRVVLLNRDSILTEDAMASLCRSPRSSPAAGGLTDARLPFGRGLESAPLALH